MEAKDYININKETWNNKVDVHIDSDFYDMEGFLKGKSTLNCIELDLLGDVKGKKVLHFAPEQIFYKLFHKNYHQKIV